MAKCKYKEDPQYYNSLVEGYAREGLIGKDIAKKIGISEDTLYEWIKRFPEFSESLKKGKAPVDFEVENALLKRALGYEYEEVKTYISDNNGVKTKRIEKTTKHHAPDVTAQIFWLKNRRSDKWRDRIENKEDSNNVSKALDILADTIGKDLKEYGNI